jgi:hypothetical protein
VRGGGGPGGDFGGGRESGDFGISGVRESVSFVKTGKLRFQEKWKIVKIVFSGKPVFGGFRGVRFGGVFRPRFQGSLDTSFGVVTGMGTGPRGGTF